MEIVTILVFSFVSICGLGNPCILSCEYRHSESGASEYINFYKVYFQNEFKFHQKTNNKLSFKLLRVTLIGRVGEQFIVLFIDIFTRKISNI